MSGSMLLNPNNTQMEVVQPIAARTNAFPVETVEDKYYYACTMLNHHMHRTDGKRLGFQFGIFVTQDKYDIEYLEKEIVAGNIYVTRATKDQIANYRMKTDPQAMMTEELSPKIEAELREKLDSELRAKMKERLTSIGVTLTTDQFEALVAKTSSESSIASTATDESKLASTAKDARMEALQRLQTGTATISLGGIVGTDRLPQAAGSNQK